MSSHRPRGYSPPRHFADQPRSSTGNFYVTSFDTTSRGGPGSQVRSSVSGSSAGRQSVEYQAQPMRKSTFADGKTRTEYAIRPRHGSFNPSDDKKPLAISTTRHNSPPRRGTVVMTSPRELAPPHSRDESSRFLQPAASHAHHGYHQRHNSTSVTEAGPRDSRDRKEKSYHSRAPYVQKVYDNRVPSRVPEDEDWSYTNEREQFDRGLFRRPANERESTSRRERAVPESYAISRSTPSAKRDPAPMPPASQQLVKVDRDSDRYARRSGHESDPDRAIEASRKRNSIRQPVLHQQPPPRDDGYSSARDDYESRSHLKQSHDRYNDGTRRSQRHRDADRDEGDAGLRVPQTDSRRSAPREYGRDYDRSHPRDYDRSDQQTDNRRKPRSRENSPERSGLKGLATTALGGLAAAGVVKGLNRDHKDKDSESLEDDDQERRHRRRRHRSRKDDQYIESDPESNRRRDDRDPSHSREASSSDVPDERYSRKQHSRRQRDRVEDDNPPEGQLVPVKNASARAHSHTRSRDQSDSSIDRPSRGQIPAHKQDRVPESLENRTMSPGEDEDDRPRRVQLVEPLKEREDLKPRGILKPARQVPFPEDPNPIREGVAPLKDATKDGIPPNARWTKISRVLVNPEALEKFHERFEERDDYVIVLRVLSREEIKKLADKTKEIRDAREKEWDQESKHRGRGKNSNEDEGTATDGEVEYGGNDDKSKSQLAIEQGPAAPPANLHNLQNGPAQQAQYQEVPAGPRIPDINVEDNYSANV